MEKWRRRKIGNRKTANILMNIYLNLNHKNQNLTKLDRTSDDCNNLFFLTLHAYIKNHNAIKPKLFLYKSSSSKRMAIPMALKFSVQVCAIVIEN